MVRGSKMKYICLRILYSSDLHITPCQSLIGIHGTFEYDPTYCGALISSSMPDDIDLMIPLSPEQYEELLEQFKVSDIIDTDYFAFYVSEEDFAHNYDVILERNKTVGLRK